MNKRRVVITGIGTINAVGNNVEDTWKGLLEGKSGVETVTRFDVSQFASQIAGTVKDFDPLNYYEKKEVNKNDLYSQYAMAAAIETFEDSGLSKCSFDNNRVGVITGVGIGGMITLEEQHEILVTKGPRRISPFFIPKMIGNIAAANIAIRYNLKGINFNCMSACASANHAIGTAFRAVQYGDADAIVAGGVEAAVTPLAFAGFCSMRALSTRNDDPQKASRPFDNDRDGFIMAEGAAFLVLEEYEHAVKRNAKIYAELVGYGATDDAYHITAPAENGEGGARAMQMAINDANITTQDIQYINAHGTSTPLNDKNESFAIRTVFGEYADKVIVNSTKSMVGHALGAAAAIEAIVCIKSILTGTIHPTINYETPDPDCNLNYTPNKISQCDIEYALSNSLGFGGHNGVLIFKKY
ncbi:MAG: beta-ketoacyl-ACP synthase II [Candidatus Cloacimonetes bacterium]|jgi:3-oxoacyl-[acyl-carrier-protein] synthase II|nr:beta-ketoacyl-ACP synthase II [Candidatus Cloacimonadota bacterium]MDD4155969.1 beta-ketoacyl-ACP synthase II [Candidatus Cloacimonadota bacterium]